jgi:hypothetical protein
MNPYCRTNFGVSLCRKSFRAVVYFGVDRLYSLALRALCKVASFASLARNPLKSGGLPHGFGNFRVINPAMQRLA